MNMPSIVHPKQFSISGMLFEIVSYGHLTDEQAAKAAMFFYRNHKFKKSDRGKLFRVMNQLDENSARLL